MQTVHPGQIRAARALLGWAQDELAIRSGVARRTVVNLELEHRALRPDVMARLLVALTVAGIEFWSNGVGAICVVMRCDATDARRSSAPGSGPDWIRADLSPLSSDTPASR